MNWKNTRVIIICYKENWCQNSTKYIIISHQMKKKYSTWMTNFTFRRDSKFCFFLLLIIDLALFSSFFRSGRLTWFNKSALTFLILFCNQAKCCTLAWPFKATWKWGNPLRNITGGSLLRGQEDTEFSSYSKSDCLVSGPAFIFVCLI